MLTVQREQTEKKSLSETNQWSTATPYYRSYLLPNNTRYITILSTIII